MIHYVLVALVVCAGAVSATILLIALSARGFFYAPAPKRQVKHRWYAWHPVYANIDAQGYRWVWRRRLIRQAYRDIEWRYQYWPYTRHPPWNHNPNRNP